ncbi:hypothetical protein GIB67_006817 [Kingdonia uniflora]|uniref:Uncharacterized protein n=1 Tax=Kingdonia uniflora TaxID=39325 RepID=A0A7J7KZX2_9MAGN|nr:hypothetical protein GIB67_006817 [Kingdonia uniflora]
MCVWSATNAIQMEQEMETVVKALQPGPLGIIEHKFSAEEVRAATATIDRVPSADSLPFKSTAEVSNLITNGEWNISNAASHGLGDNAGLVVDVEINHGQEDEN